MVKYTLNEHKSDCDRRVRAQYFHLCGNGVTINVAGDENPSWSTDTFSILKTTFLPSGYPNSVRMEYITYQYWDSIQGMSSYLRSVLTTRSILAGAGVGSAETTALAAALTWIFRDGLGMIGSLLFAYKYSGTFEIYIKEWRYLADVLNNVGLTLDLLSADFPRYYFALTSISTLCKACCGLIAGATKARISAHFAMPGHLADVTAKESTQETAVALVGLVVGMLLAQVIGNDDRSVWVTFSVLLLIHQYANYNLVKVLVFHNLNPQRCFLLAKHATTTSPSPGVTSSERRMETAVLSSPLDIASKESFSTPFYLAYFGPEVGCSLHSIVGTIQFIVCNRSGTFVNNAGWEIKRPQRAASCYGETIDSKDGFNIFHSSVGTFFGQLASCWEKEQFLVGVNMHGRVVVSLKEGVSNKSIVKAYMVAYYVFVKLDASTFLFGAKLSAKQQYLTELYAYLIGTLAAEALRWYEAVTIPVGNDDKTTRSSVTAVSDLQGAPSSEPPADTSKLPLEPEGWNLEEVASLAIGEWRYSDIIAKQD